MRAPFSWPNYLQKVSPLNTITLGIRASIHELGGEGNKNIQSTAARHKLCMEGRICGYKHDRETDDHGLSHAVYERHYLTNRVIFLYTKCNAYSFQMSLKSTFPLNCCILCLTKLNLNVKEEMHYRHTMSRIQDVVREIPCVDIAKWR